MFADLLASPVIASHRYKSAITYSKLQHVFNPANGLVNILMRAYQRLWNETKDLPLGQNGVCNGDFVHPKIHCPSSPVHEVWIRI